MTDLHRADPGPPPKGKPTTPMRTGGGGAALGVIGVLITILVAWSAR